MNITTIGLDLAKEIFEVYALRRSEMAKFFANLKPCLIGMEACGGAHHWAIKLEEFGHTVKLMALQFVKSYVKTNKNDAANAEAIRV